MMWIWMKIWMRMLIMCDCDGGNLNDNCDNVDGNGVNVAGSKWKLEWESRKYWLWWY